MFSKRYGETLYYIRIWILWFFTFYLQICLHMFSLDFLVEVTDSLERNSMSVIILFHTFSIFFWFVKCTLLLMRLLSSTSLMKWCFTCMCFIFAWKTGFCASMIALWLWEWRAGNYVMPRSPTRHEIHKASLHSSVAATYSVSVVANATYFCSLEVQEAAPRVNVTHNRKWTFCICITNACCKGLLLLCTC